MVGRAVLCQPDMLLCTRFCWGPLLVGMVDVSRMQPQVHARVVFVGYEMVVLAGFDHADISGYQPMPLSIYLHACLALQDNECLAVIFVHMNIAPTGPIIGVGPNSRGLESHAAHAEKLAGKNVAKEMSAAYVGEFAESIVFHGSLSFC